ncbi:MAG: carbohydrate kinase family protein [Candidatus Peribacteraceae bacterium]|nr:carbohydrate kinase family protein [Candidatus Peribacteraceae bacterium]
MPHRTLSIGGATYDLFVRLPKDTIRQCMNEDAFALPLGAKIRIEDLIETSGGGACNTSVGLSRLGCTACFEGVVGSDQWGEKLLQNLTNENVDTGCVTVVEEEVSSFSIVLSGTKGERVILYEPGTNAHLHDANFNKDMLSQVDWVYLNHIQERSCTIQDDMSEMLATDDGPRLTWNPGGCQIDMGMTHSNNMLLLKHTTLLLLNKQEALKFTEKDTIEDSIKALLGAGVQNVCVTDGGNGTVASDGQHLYRCGVVPNVKIIDTTGAGDAFGTGTTWGLLEGMTLPEAVKTGSINAASVVGNIGAQTALLTDTKIKSQLKEVDLDVTIDSL